MSEVSLLSFIFCGGLLLLLAVALLCAGLCRFATDLSLVWFWPPALSDLAVGDGGVSVGALFRRWCVTGPCLFISRLLA